MRPSRSCFQNEQAGEGSSSLHIYEWFGERRPSVSGLPFPSAPLLMGLLYLQDPSVNETGRKLTRADKSRLQRFRRCRGTFCIIPFPLSRFFVFFSLLFSARYEANIDSPPPVWQRFTICVRANKRLGVQMVMTKLLLQSDKKPKQKLNFKSPPYTSNGLAGMYVAERLLGV